MADQSFYTDNETGTIADPLKAVGLAEVLRAWLRAIGHEEAPIVIEDAGRVYHIRLPSLLDRDCIAGIETPFLCGRAQFFHGRREPVSHYQAELPFEGFPYSAMQQQRARFLEGLQALTPAERARFYTQPEAEEFAGLQALTPHPDLRLYGYLSQFKAADGYNALLRQWWGEDLSTFRLSLELVLDTFTQQPNPVALASERWERFMRAHQHTSKGSVTRWQLVNPSSGKGASAVKANSLHIGNRSGFWLIEYLKLVGLFTLAAPLMVTGSKDRKTYVLHPVKVELSALDEVLTAFRQRLLTTTAIKLDILTALRFTRLLVGYLQQTRPLGQRANPDSPALGHPLQVTDIARGFDVVSYKDMGSAYVVMNQATIQLPSWLRPTATIKDAQALLALLDEHLMVLASIRADSGEEGPEEITLLRQYRDFFSGREGERFFEMAAYYGDYLLAKRRRHSWCPQLTTRGMEKLVEKSTRSKNVLPMLENPGFRAVAAAIRNATVIAQYYAAQGKGYPFEVRYGLGQELLHAAAYPDSFLDVLGKFVHAYLAENARTSERITKGSLPDLPAHHRRAIRTEHLAQIAQLINEYGTALLGTMLVAYGYARDTTTPLESEQTSDMAASAASEEPEDVS